MRNYVKLCEEDKALIIECAKERKRLIAESKKLSQQMLAEKFGISVHTIKNIEKSHKQRRAPC